MATINHIGSKNADYGAAEQYLTFEYDEFTMKSVLDESGRLMLRTDYRMETLRGNPCELKESVNTLTRVIVENTIDKLKAASPETRISGYFIKFSRYVIIIKNT